VRRIAFTLPDEAAQEAVDALVPLLPQGVHERALGDGTTEISFFEHAQALPRDELVGAAGTADWHEEEVPDDPRARRARQNRAWEVAGRLRVRSPLDPPGDGTVPELVIESAAGAFGTGAHPTTRMCLELLLELEPGGPFADLGCGAGVLAIAAAQLGWTPVLAVDHEPRSVDAARRNAERNGVAVEARVHDLRDGAPWASTVLANLPKPVLLEIAGRLGRLAHDLAPATRIIASGMLAAEADEVVAAFGMRERRRLEREGWAGVVLG